MSLPATSTPQNVLQIKLTDLAGEKFKDMFYAIFDSHRSDLIRFFAPRSICVWEGNSVGMQNLPALFTRIPPTKHTITTLDVHSISPPTPTSSTIDSISAVSSLLVSVSGKVVYGFDTAAPVGFFHSFVIQQIPTNSSNTTRNFHYITAASFRTRFLVDPEKQKKSYQPQSHNYHR